jgi:hypothetical protein
LFPSSAVYQGYYKHDDQLLVPNGELRALRRTFFVNELQAIKSFDANQLSSNNATDLAIIEGHLKSSLWYIDSFRSYEWNPAQYNPAGTFGLILNTEYKTYLQRIEVISRRVQSYVDAYAVNSQKPNWGLGKYYEAASQDCDAVGTDLKRYIARQAKEEFDLQLAASRVRDMRAGGSTDRGGGWAEADDGVGDDGAGATPGPKARAGARTVARASELVARPRNDPAMSPDCS